MYCSTCRHQLTPGLSFCNRCGSSLKDRTSGAGGGTMAAFLTAITLIALGGLGIMLGGTIVLRMEAHVGGEIIGPFMVMTFLVVLIVEVYLCRQLSRLSGRSEKSPAIYAPVPPNEIHSDPQRVLSEHAPSVTENTTRTLEYSRNEAARR